MRTNNKKILTKLKRKKKFTPGFPGCFLFFLVVRSCGGGGGEMAVTEVGKSWTLVPEERLASSEGDVELDMVAGTMK